jgi:hypothetical protein
MGKVVYWIVAAIGLSIVLAHAMVGALKAHRAAQKHAPPLARVITSDELIAVAAIVAGGLFLLGWL